MVPAGEESMVRSMKSFAYPLSAGLLTIAGAGYLLSQQPLNEGGTEVSDVPHAECSFFARDRERFSPDRARKAIVWRGAVTQQVAGQLTFVPGGSRTSNFEGDPDTIDKYLFAAMEEAGVKPAGPATDVEFLRRATLDLTGRIPPAAKVVEFSRDPSPDKKARLVEELLQSPEWVDRWTMYFGDLYKNNADKPSVNLRRFPPGRNAFWKWIRDSLAANKPYDQMARELIAAHGSNSFEDGSLNWVVGGWVINRPEQDNWDQQAANVAETFLGVGHMNCILCHNGRGHLDALSLWGKTTSRTTAWGMASFFSKTGTVRVNRPRIGNAQTYYWQLEDRTVNPRNGRPIPDYPLNTTTGNRPARQPIGNLANIAPAYPFSGRGPEPGENYRDALAREVTSDFQFARATVNYLWKQFFGLGLVEPVNQFDLARLDPDHPPPSPWSLQPSNPRLLNALAQEFVQDKFDLKRLMAKIANSRAYQLSARYEGEWKPEWNPLFARKLVRRLMAEEIHDAIVVSSNVVPTYNIAEFSVHAATSPYEDMPVYGPVSFAMQFPEPFATPSPRDAVSGFLDSFSRGDRDDDVRESDGSLLQALNLMNDNFVLSRIRPNGPADSLLRRNLSLPNEELITNLFLAVLSRYPSEAERSVALAALQTGNRNAQAQNLLWSLYNKVDFIFNY